MRNKILLFFLGCGLVLKNNANANTKFEIVNMTDKVIEIKNDTYIKYTLYPTKLSEYNLINPGKNKYINTNDDVNFNGYFNLKLIEKNIDCSWVTILGVKVRHGTVIDIKVNDQSIGEFCVNKCSIVDLLYHGKIEIQKSQNNNYFLKFYNTGWWLNEGGVANYFEVEF